MDSIVAIIPARGGSKRIPGKNIAPLMGKPMICWSIEAALESNLFDHVIVSTDSTEIANIAKTCGAEVPFLRNPKDSDDYTFVSVATVNALREFEKHINEEIDIVVQLMPNCPLRNSKDIREAFEAFEDSSAEFQISVFSCGWMNSWWSMYMDPETKEGRQIFPDAFDKRSQQLDKLYIPTGATWIAKGQSLKQSNTFYGDGFRIHPMTWERAIDIDDYDDLYFAKTLGPIALGTGESKSG